MTDTRAGLVSVILVNYRGADDTIACLLAFDDVDWPIDRVELLVVDNASGDGSAARIRQAVPRARVIEAPTNTGFAGGCNLGVSEALGEYVGFINNDARPHPNWIRAAVEVLDRDAAVACVASKVLDWDGTHIDYVDGSLTWFGMGYKREVERLDSAQYDVPHDVLFATGAAMFVRADVYRDVGGFDERFFMFYEDVDLGWRLNLLGHRVRYVAASLAYHKHHQSMKKFGSFREQYLLERNALMSMYKNYDDAMLAKVLPAAMALAVRRGLARGGDDAAALDLSRSPGGDDIDRLEISKSTLTGPYAIDYFVAHLPSLLTDRRKLQAMRKKSDAELLPLFRQAMEPAYGDPAYLAGYASVVEAFGIEDLFSRRRRIAVVTGEPLGDRMAGPAIRAWEIAKALSAEHEVVLATMGSCSATSADFVCRSVSGHDLRKLEGWCDVLIFQGLILSIHPWLKRSKKVLVADLYDPFHLEVLEQEKDKSDAIRLQSSEDTVDALNVQLLRGDFFMCASSKQRDLWIGQLAGVGRVNPATYDLDETLGKLISVVPFGISETPPKRTASAIKGVVEGIGHDDSVILWGGGIYNWFDPLTLIRAVDRLRERRPDVRLYFLGIKHPNPDVPEMRMSVRTRELSDRLGLTDRFVFFNEGWVPYDERQNYLLDADIGVSCHLDHVETAYSFRTRILDYLWASLPVVTTEGDTFGDLVTSHGLGVAVPAGDVEALEEALFRLLDDTEFAGQCRKQVELIAPQFVWADVLAPLVEFCRAPRRAPDLLDELGDTELGRTRPVRVRYRPSLADNIDLAKRYFRQGGLGEVVRRALGRVQRVSRESLSGSRSRL
jgi:GT2 family glycosyltransferase/glycosyltransferase involved in cell wall biosynthesis